ncbi:hypothetical protein E5Q_00708 [Mixia osmundae IAM 14324]|uniref:Potassium channel domain-containing protein n=1 Tax=Mixia osmundae (strain CBS 9802 / IAM 14324 / JCM 22182 / KY 12970) TaxID=764103 RepID=G7DU01_MIXOS|nr:hypothetical protein E5Q_00708 [Mixia osmundae IAM 14324]
MPMFKRIRTWASGYSSSGDTLSILDDDTTLAESANFRARLKGPKTRYLPLLSGTLVPFAILLEIPGLTQRWYVKTASKYTNEVLDSQKNPVLLDVALGISIGMAIIANICLVMRFLERRVWITTVIACIALTFHDCINISALTYFGVVHSVSDGFTYGQPFFMTIASTSVSTVCNFTLLYDFFSTKNFANHGSGLTAKQRQLVIALIAFMCYLCFGSLVFTLSMSLHFVDALYFTIVTCSSVGFGDIYPTSIAVRVFDIFFATGGIIFLALLIAVARETLLESFQQAYTHRRKLLVERARLRRKQKAAHRAARLKAREEALASGQDVPAAYKPGGGRSGARSMGERLESRKIKVGVSAGKDWIDSWFVKWGWKDSISSVKLKRSLTQESMDQDRSYQHFKKQLKSEERREFWVKLGFALGMFFFFWGVGSFIFTLTEGWDYFDAFWFSFVYFSTIGYGDFSPKSSAGRAFFICWALLGIANLTLLFSILTESWGSVFQATVQNSGTSKIRRLGENEVHDTEEEDAHDDIDDLPDKITHAAKEFHEHANYFLKQGSKPPEALQKLLDDSSQLTEENIARLRASTGLSNDSDSSHLLFMISYERSFANLMESCTLVSAMLRKREEDLARLRQILADLDETKPSLTRTDTMISQEARPRVVRVVSDMIHFNSRTGNRDLEYGEKSDEDGDKTDPEDEEPSEPREPQRRTRRATIIQEAHDLISTLDKGTADSIGSSGSSDGMSPVQATQSQPSVVQRDMLDARTSSLPAPIIGPNARLPLKRTLTIDDPKPAKR